MSTANEHVFSHGMQDTRQALEAWNGHPWGVLRGWLLLSLAVALTLLGAVWAVAGLLTPDLTPIHMPGLQDVAERLSTAFDTRVTVSLGKRKGKIVVEFGSVEDLQRIVDLMNTSKA